MLSACQKNNESFPKSENDTKVSSKPLFIGVHLNSQQQLVVGYSNSDGSFSSTDSVSGEFSFCQSNMPTSTISDDESYFYFTYQKDCLESNPEIRIGQVEVKTGKFIKSINTNLKQNSYINLFAKQNMVYLSNSNTLYSINFANNTVNKVKPLFTGTSNGTRNPIIKNDFIIHNNLIYEYSFIENNGVIENYLTVSDFKNNEITKIKISEKGNTFRTMDLHESKIIIIEHSEHDQKWIYHLIDISSNKLISSKNVSSEDCGGLQYNLRYSSNENKVYYRHTVMQFFECGFIELHLNKTTRIPTKSMIAQGLFNEIPKN